MGWVDAEGNAHTLRVWQPIIFPGLIQTEAYARELYAVAGFSEDQISEFVQSRLSRHAILDRPDPPSVVIVLDEVVLHRLIGSPEVMRGQLAHVIELSKRPNMHIHILPSRTGANARLGGPIHLATGTGTPEVLLVGALIEDQVTLELNRCARQALPLMLSGAMRSTAQTAGTCLWRHWRDGTSRPPLAQGHPER